MGNIRILFCGDHLQIPPVIANTKITTTNQLANMAIYTIANLTKQNNDEPLVNLFELNTLFLLMTILMIFPYCPRYEYFFNNLKKVK